MELSQQKLSRQKEMLKETFMEWKDGQEQVDDVCFIGITITND
jgi:hypothetical protein